MFVVDYNTIREFDATTGATINYYFGGADTPRGMVVDAFNHLFVTSGTRRSSSTTRSPARSSSPLSSRGNTYPQGLTLDDNNHLFVTYSDFNTSFEAVGEYNATTGAAINVDFINGQGLDQPESIVFVNFRAGAVVVVVAGRRRRLWRNVPPQTVRRRDACRLACCAGCGFRASSRPGRVFC